MRADGNGDDGQARLRRWQQGADVPPAVTRLGVALEAVGDATTTVRLPVRGELLLPGGRATAAPVAMVADTGLTTAVVASLPDTRAVTTVSMALDLVAPVPTAGSLAAVCTAAPYDDGRPQLATGTVHDDAGRLVARLSGWFVASAVDVAAGASASGAPGEPPAPDVVALLDLQPNGGGAQRLTARPALANLAGTLHGGVGALACAVVTEQLLGPGAPLLTCSLTYLRAVPRGASAELGVELVRRGRRTAVATARLVGMDGRTALTATCVAAVLPAERGRGLVG